MPPTTRAMARRRIAFVAVAACAMGLGVVLGAVDNDPSPPPWPPATSAPAAVAGALQGAATSDAGPPERTLRRTVGQTIVLRFTGPSMPRFVARALRRGEVAGVILFSDNVASDDQVSALTRDLQRAAGGSALVSVDQEGGAVRRLPSAAPRRAQSKLASPGAAARAATHAANDLSALGVNVNLAPVADVATGAGAVMRERAYPGDASSVASFVGAALPAYRDRDVGATAKHFPGFGAATRNTDDAPVTIERSTSELEDVDLLPFRDAIEASVPLVMASHAHYPAFEPERIASQSRPILIELLRDRLGFEGVTVTDSLEARAAVRAAGSAPRAAARSIKAGADLALLTSEASYRPTFEKLLARARSSDAVRRRVGEAAERVVALKRWLGLAPPPVDR